MNIQLIIYILIAFALGCVIAWFIARCKVASRPKPEEFQELQNIKNSIEGELVTTKELNIQLQSQIQEKEKLITDKISETEATLKAKYENLLSQIETENKRLDSALRLATEGKIEDSVKAQLLEAQKSSAKAIEMDKELQELRTKYAEIQKESEPIRLNLEQAKEECAKLVKKVKKLEDEVEEAEDEQEALEKKLKAKGAELLEANEQLEKSGKENQQLHTELEEKDRELTNRIDELKRKSGSIEFIREILSAKKTGAQDVKELYQSIDFFESFLRGQFMDCNAYLYNTYTSLSFNNASGRAGFQEKKKIFLQLFEEWASVKRKSWLDKKTTIAFVGEFSAGKTSIVNRILSQDNPNIPLLPVSAKATTAIPTYIAGGPTETYNFVTPDNQLKSISQETFKKVSKEVLDEIKGVSSLIQYFVMTYKNPNLKGLSILDTPGFNSNDAEDKERTIGVINECDALFWVFDVNAGTVNRSSIALIKEKLNKPLIVVINKVDTKSTAEVDKVEALIRKTLEEEGVAIDEFVRFSAKSPLKDIMNPIHRIKHDENRDNFIEFVREDLEQLLNIINNEVKVANNKYNECRKNSDKITQNFVSCLHSLQADCNTARNIPNFVEGTKIFGVELTSNRYEMSCQEANQLKHKLDRIASEICNQINTIYISQTDCTAEVQQTYSDMVDLKTSWQKIDDCLKEFKKTIKNIK